jgi:hypothetical protein
MPVESKAQAGFAAMSRTAAGRAKLRAHGKKPMPAGVADDYLQESKGMKFSRLPRHVRTKGGG